VGRAVTLRGLVLLGLTTEDAVLDILKGPQ
jgi:hypothetical protein